jgi:hypothetical protein
LFKPIYSKFVSENLKAVLSGPKADAIKGEEEMRIKAVTGEFATPWNV